MILVLSLIAVLWVGGWALNIPRSLRVLLVGLLLAVVILLHLTLPDGHAIRVATGFSAAPWISLIIVIIAIYGYAALLSRLRTRADPVEKRAVAAGPFVDAELERYARHIVMREIGGPGQKALRDASVLVVGAGGLGSPVLLYLAAGGVGTIGVIDDDVVDNSNLQRQVIHTDARIGLPKVQSAAEAMRAQNPFVTVKPYHRRLTPEIAEDLFADYDLVLDGTDNFATRYLVNAACVKTATPLIAAAMTQWEGQISLYDPANGTPCYQCVFPESPDPSLVPSCAEAGVIGPLPGVMGSMMAIEAIKQITGAGEGLRGRLLIYDALYAETRTMTMKPRPDCPICG